MRPIPYHLNTPPASDKEVFEIRGNVPDPTGTGLLGTSVGMDMQRAAIAHPKVFYGDRIAEVDVYEAGDGSQLMLVMYCPRCAGSLRITSERKEIRFEPSDRHGGRLSISPFLCTYGCGLHVEVEDNIAHDYANGRRVG